MPYVEREPLAEGLAAYMRAYVVHLQARQYSVQTVRYQQMSLLAFFAWIDERGIVRLTEITRPVLQRYQRHLAYATSRSGKPLSASGQFNRLTALRGFFWFLTRENVLLYNPACELELPKLEKRLPKDVLTAPEAEAVLSQPEIDTPAGLRDRAILEVLYSTGIRRLPPRPPPHAGAPQSNSHSERHAAADILAAAVRRQGRG